jgi:hypothetical protein
MHRTNSIVPGILVRCLVFGMAYFTPGFSADTVKVFILAGQSNMAGVTPTAGLPSNLTQIQPDVMIYADGHINPLKVNQWLNLGPDFGYDLGYFGPELTFGRTMADSSLL